ncbi:MAG: hypothetical protein R3D02_11885 [Hyphomicrobiales bacterium]
MSTSRCRGKAQALIVTALHDAEQRPAPCCTKRHPGASAQRTESSMALHFRLGRRQGEMHSSELA